MRIKPLADRVLVLPTPVQKSTEDGILLPTKVMDRPLEGTVSAVGDGKDGKPMSVKVGDSVLYGKHAGVDVSYQGQKYLLMRECDIFAIL